MKKILFCFILFFILAPVGFAETETPDVIPKAEVTEPDPQAIYITKDLKIVPKKNLEENKDQHITIEVIYPQIEGKDLNAHALEFNKLVSDRIQQEIQQFKDSVHAEMPNLETLPEELRKNNFRIDFDIDLVTPKDKHLISVRFSIEGFQAGSAHPYHKFQVLNFDLSNGKELALNDLFKPSAKYLTVFSQYSKKVLHEKLDDKSFISTGTEPVAKNFKNWNIQNDSILITFDEYQVAPYSYGPQEIEIPYSMLKSSIVKKAPIYPCAQQPGGCKEKKLVEKVEEVKG